MPPHSHGVRAWQTSSTAESCGRLAAGPRAAAAARGRRHRCCPRLRQETRDTRSAARGSGVRGAGRRPFWRRALDPSLHPSGGGGGGGASAPRWTLAPRATLGTPPLLAAQGTMSRRVTRTSSQAQRQAAQKPQARQQHEVQRRSSGASRVKPENEKLIASRDRYLLRPGLEWDSYCLHKSHGQKYRLFKPFAPVPSGSTRGARCQALFVRGFFLNGSEEDHVDVKDLAPLKDRFKSSRSLRRNEFHSQSDYETALNLLGDNHDDDDDDDDDEDEDDDDDDEEEEEEEEDDDDGDDDAEGTTAVECLPPNAIGRSTFVRRKDAAGLPDRLSPVKAERDDIVHSLVTSSEDDDDDDDDDNVGSIGGGYESPGATKIPPPHAKLNLGGMHHPRANMMQMRPIGGKLWVGNRATLPPRKNGLPSEEQSDEDSESSSLEDIDDSESSSENEASNDVLSNESNSQNRELAMFNSYDQQSRAGTPVRDAQTAESPPKQLKNEALSSVNASVIWDGLWGSVPNSYRKVADMEKVENELDRMGLKPDSLNRKWRVRLVAGENGVSRTFTDEAGYVYKNSAKIISIGLGRVRTDVAYQQAVSAASKMLGNQALADAGNEILRDQAAALKKHLSVNSGSLESPRASWILQVEKNAAIALSAQHPFPGTSSQANGVNLQGSNGIYSVAYGAGGASGVGVNGVGVNGVGGDDEVDDDEDEDAADFEDPEKMKRQRAARIRSIFKITGPLGFGVKKESKQNDAVQVTQLGFLTRHKSACQDGILFPAGFEAHRHFVRLDGGFPEPQWSPCLYSVTVHGSANSPVQFKLHWHMSKSRSSKRQVIHQAKSPLELWQPIIRKWVDTVDLSFKRHLAAVEAATDAANAAKGAGSTVSVSPVAGSSVRVGASAANAAGTRQLLDQSDANEVASFLQEHAHTRPCGQNEGIVEVALKGKSGLIVHRRPASNQEGTSWVIVGFNGGSIGSGANLARIGDTIEGFWSVGTIKWRRPSEVADVAEHLSNTRVLLRRALPLNGSQLLTPQGNDQKAQVLYKLLLCDPHAAREADEDARHQANLAAAALCGLVDASWQFQTVCAAMPEALWHATTEDFCLPEQIPRGRKKVDLKFIAGFETDITKLVRSVTNPKTRYYIKLQRDVAKANQQHLKIEDPVSQRPSTRKDAADNAKRLKWQKLVHDLIPPIVFAKSGAPNVDESARDSVARVFQLHPSALHKQLHPSLPFSLEPVYETMEAPHKRSANPDFDASSTEDQVGLVLDVMFGFVELGSWNKQQKEALYRSIMLRGPDLDALVKTSDSKDAKILRDSHFTETSLHLRCIQKRVIQEKAEFEHVEHAHTIERILKKLVRDVEKGHREFKAEQKHKRTVRKKLQQDRAAEASARGPMLIPSELASLCAAARRFGRTSWAELSSSRELATTIFPVQRAASALERAWEELSSVICISGHKGQLYPLMGFYVRLGKLASLAYKDRREMAPFFAPERAAPDGSETFVFIGPGGNFAPAQRLIGKYVLKLSLCRSVWMIQSSRSMGLDDAHLYGQLDESTFRAANISASMSSSQSESPQQNFVFSHQSGSWVTDTSLRLSVLKFHEEALELPKIGDLPALTAAEALQAGVDVHEDSVAKKARAANKDALLRPVPFSAAPSEIQDRIRAIRKYRRALEAFEHDLLARLDEGQAQNL